MIRPKNCLGWHYKRLFDAGISIDRSYVLHDNVITFIFFFHSLCYYFEFTRISWLCLNSYNFDLFRVNIIIHSWNFLKCFSYFGFRLSFFMITQVIMLRFLHLMFYFWHLCFLSTSCYVFYWLIIVIYSRLNFFIQKTLYEFVSFRCIIGWVLH